VRVLQNVSAKCLRSAQSLVILHVRGVTVDVSVGRLAGDVVRVPSGFAFSLSAASSWFCCTVGGGSCWMSSVSTIGNTVAVQCLHGERALISRYAVLSRSDVELPYKIFGSAIVG